MKRLIEFIILGTSCAMLGCNEPSHQTQLKRREQNLQKTAQIFKANEADRSEKLGRTLSILKRQHEEDVENTSRNPERIRQWLEDDVTRWKERQPLYRKEIENQLKGDPENIKRTAPLMIY